MQSIGNKVVSRIYGNGRGWAFSSNDFSDIASRSSIDTALHRLREKGTIRQVMRGIYDYPRFSNLLNQEMSPDIDQVANALARKFAWRIQPSPQAAMNMMGLSTQVPGKFSYLSDGPNRAYEIGKITLDFKNASLKDSGFKMPESTLIVQSLKSLGKERLTPEVIASIREWLQPNLRTKVLKDTRTAVAWVHDAIREICRENNNG